MAETVTSTKSIMFSPDSSSLKNQNQNQIQNPISIPIPMEFPSLKLRNSPLGSSDFLGRRIVVKSLQERGHSQASTAQMNIRIGKAQKWWEKGLQPNMKEVTGAQDLVTSLLNGGDELVVVDFFSPGCGGCRALHPKICQLAEMNPDVKFLQVNYEEHKSMCYALNVHVLPFFRFYRGAQGRLCSFSCTNATIKKFKDALGKHGPDRCSLGATKGLEEKELLALSANKDLDFVYTPPNTSEKSTEEEEEKIMVEIPPSSPTVVENSNSGAPLPLPFRRSSNSVDWEDKNLMETRR